MKRTQHQQFLSNMNTNDSLFHSGIRSTLTQRCPLFPLDRLFLIHLYHLDQTRRSHRFEWEIGKEFLSDRIFSITYRSWSTSFTFIWRMFLYMFGSKRLSGMGSAKIGAWTSSFEGMVWRWIGDDGEVPCRWFLEVIRLEQSRHRICHLCGDPSHGAELWTVVVAMKTMFDNLNQHSGIKQN